jgi:2-polyprenyl-3-methyl-5-hydroxy-6-metoxy-1,4-benzoquinol methylase
MKISILPINGGRFRAEYLTREDIKAFVPQAECPACGSNSERKILVAVGGDTIEESLKVTLCEICAHVTYDKLPSVQWTEQFYKKIWDRAGRETKTGYVSQLPLRLSRWNHLLALKIPKDARVLDFGCGFGDGLMELRALGYHNVFGVEIGEHRARESAKYFPGRIRCGSVEEAAQMAKEVGCFDLIVCRHVFEHLREPYYVLTELAKLLTHKGIALIIVPDIYGETPIITTMYLPHMHLFNRTSMMQMAERTGLNPYTWTPSEHEVVVAATPNPEWRPPATHYFSNEKNSIDVQFISCLAKFISGPWQTIPRKGSSLIAYFQPPEISKYPAGFLILEKHTWWTLFVALQRMRILPFMSGKPVLWRLHSSIISRLGRDRRMVTKVMRASPIGSSEIPWLVMPDGATPILVK